MKVSDIQTKIFNELGIKTSVKIVKSGSMKGYIYIRPIFQNGIYPNFPIEWIRELRKELDNLYQEPRPAFCNTTEISIYQIEDDRITYKKECKPKPKDTEHISKGWGSKNSQIRLDKATARYAKRLNKGGCARYY
jgi:hypothetical protein